MINKSSGMDREATGGRRGWRAWFSLVRLPNLFTVPGDPVAGAALAGGATAGQLAWPGLLLAVAASLCFYVCGMIGNDLFDQSEDARDRPWRPLPSGLVSSRAAATAALLLAAAGLGLAWLASALAAGAILLLLILLYDGGGKRIPVAGPLLMGCCRGGSLWLGAVAVAGHIVPPSLAVGLAGIVGYVTAVSLLSVNETRQARLGYKRELPWLVVLTTVVTVLACASTPGLPALAVGAVAILLPWRRARRLGAAPPPNDLQAAVGALVRGIIPLQSLLLMAAGGTAALLAGMGILFLWLPAEWASRSWQSS